jgi:inorganic pyrophosphatase
MIVRRPGKVILLETEKSCIHAVNDPPYRNADGTYNMVVEIPAGTNEKWQADPVTGQFYHDKIDGVPRVINYLAYPFNYGFIPQTVLSKRTGGDGDPLDAIILTSAKARGSVNTMRVIGALHLVERGEIDTKIIGLMDGEAFRDVSDLPEMLFKYPDTVPIIRKWFEGYKGSGAFVFKGYADREEAIQLIEQAHSEWKADQNNV